MGRCFWMPHVHVQPLFPLFFPPSFLAYQNIVPWAIHKGNVPLQLPHLSILLENVRRRRALRSVIPRHAVFSGDTFKDLGVGVP